MRNGNLHDRRHGFDCFRAGFFILFLELSCIRWFASQVTFVQFFTNTILLGCFLGMSLGCLRASDPRSYFAAFPRLLFFSLALAIGSSALYQHWSALAIDVGGQTAAPEVVFFGTETRVPDLARFVVPIEAVALLFFVMVAVLFVGPGQIMGRSFNAHPHRLKAYTANIAGSLCGIVAFTACSFLWAPPLVWIAVIAALSLSLFERVERIGVAYLIAAGLVTVPASVNLAESGRTIWSPYYAIDFREQTGSIFVDSIGQQTIQPWSTGSSTYSLFHVLNRASGGAPYRRVLIIGAGNGNDIVHALKAGAESVTAVEIDPAIAHIGATYHPDRPYDDPRVTFVNDDGRHFLRTTDQRFDLVIYALVDSLVLHSSFSSIRLESFLFTEEAVRSVRAVLEPGGTFVMYNFFRQGFVVDRMHRLLAEEFGAEPVLITLPHLGTVSAAAPANGFSVLIAGGSARFARFFSENDTLPLWEPAPANDDPALRIGAARTDVRATVLEPTAEPVLLPTDDWPFLYTRDAAIPEVYLRSAFGILCASLAMMVIFRPRAGAVTFEALPLFWMGAGFMLLEASTVVRFSMRFGSTWIVNSAVFLGILSMILAGNIAAERIRIRNPIPPLLLVMLCLGAAYLLPLESYGTAAMLGITVLPVLFAALAFAAMFARTAHPDSAIAVNIMGAMLGGVLEYCSMLTGFRGVLLIIGCCYLLAAAAHLIAVRRRCLMATPLDGSPLPAP